MLRSGLLRKLHAGLTKRPSVATLPPQNPSAAALVAPSQPGAAAAGSSLQHLALSQQRQQPTAASAPQPAAALGKSAAAVPAAALAAHLGSGGVLQDFLQLARESVATDAGHLSAQISVLDQVGFLELGVVVSRDQSSSLSSPPVTLGGASGPDLHSCCGMAPLADGVGGGVRRPALRDLYCRALINVTPSPIHNP